MNENTVRIPLERVEHIYSDLYVEIRADRHNIQYVELVAVSDMDDSHEHVRIQLGETEGDTWLTPKFRSEAREALSNALYAGLGLHDMMEYPEDY